MALEWHVIEAAQYYAMPRIEIGWSIIAADIEAILQAGCVDAGKGVIVERFRVGIGCIELEIVREVLGNREPQRVVVRVRAAIYVVEVAA
jgi:hypothetical protein